METLTHLLPRYGGQNFPKPLPRKGMETRCEVDAYRFRKAFPKPLPRKGMKTTGGGLEPMGQYYQFLNTTKKIESTIPLPFNFNLPYAKSLENYSKEELREKFDFVIQNNNWDKDDVVIAIGDYGTIFYYPED